MMKKKVDVVTKINDKDQLSKYFAPDYTKIVVINVYDKFWGPCEVADFLIKRFQEDPVNTGKYDFLNAEKDIAGEMFSKYKFGSKPKYFLVAKGELVSFIDGIDFPKLTEEMARHYADLENES